MNKNKKLLIKLITGVVFMFGFCYLLVPIFNLVCKQTGINGKVFGQAAVDPNMKVDTSRTITIEFTTTLHNNLHFTFQPIVHHIDIHPGETKQVYFYAENEMGKRMVVQAVPSIAPGEAAKYLKKTQCFCFTQQAFFPNEKVDMPVIFHVDPDIPSYINLITLNYTLFDATKFIKKNQHPVVKGRIEL